MKKFIGIILMAIALCGCNNSDDINEIFINRNWTLSFFQEGTTRTPSPEKENYIIRFYDGSFAASSTNGAEITGNWSADSKTRDFACTNIRTNSIAESDITASKMVTFLRKATHYDGDANWLQIKQTDNVYMQFHNK